MRYTGNKKQILFVLLFVCLFCFGGFVRLAEAELVGYWKLDEGTGTIAHDSSGKGNNGTITGAAWLNDGVMGQVLDFEGIDYVSIPAAAFSTVSSKVTLALWQYGDAALQPQNNTILWGSNSANNRVLNVHLPWGSGSVIFDAGALGAEYDRVDKAASAYQYEGQWNHWAFTKDTVSGVMSIYLNGSLWVSVTGKTKSMSGITQFKLGSTINGTTNNYDGMICEFRVYDHVLSLQEIGALAGQSTSTEPSPADKTIDVEPYPTLSWTPGLLAQSHDIYIGTNKDLVAARDASVYAGRVTTNSFTPAMLKLATIYYWAVNDINPTEPGSPWRGDVWKLTVRNSTEGYYKDLFFDAGVYTDGYKAADVPACGMLGYSNEHVDTESMSLNQNIMGVTSIGAWKDGNGVLLYPDREPRFRMIFVNGGNSTTHFDRLGTAAQNNVHDFYFNGGSYTGNCAGAWCVGFKRFDISPLSLGSAKLGGTYTDGTFPDGQTSYKRFQGGNWVWKPPLPRSPFIDYYPEVFGDLKIHSIRQNGGPCVNQLAGNFNENAEALVLFDYTWTWRYNYENQPILDLTVVGRDEQKSVHNQCMVWSYKHASGTTGKMVPSSSHPEHITTYGEEKYLQAAIFRHAFSGFGRATVKGALIDGITRVMNDNSRAAYAKIGDLQYHHFTYEVLPGTTRLEVKLDGNLYDMNLYAKLGDFAFNGERDVISAANGTSSDETLVIDHPASGTWYIGVKCNEKVAATYGGANYVYNGRLELLNGIAYSITAATKRVIEGDIDHDGLVDKFDLKTLAENWLIDNGHYRQTGQLIGRWDFTCEDTNEIVRFAKDSSGYGDTVTFYGDANWADEGIVLDGAGDYMQTANNNNLQLTGDYTIALRLNTAGTQVDGTGIIVKSGSEAAMANHWSLCFGGGTSAGKILAYNGMVMWDTGIVLAEIAGNWHSIAVVFGHGYMGSYLDGVQKKREPFASLPVGGEGNLKIGCDRQKLRYYKGQIDDISIFNYELTPEEVERISSEGDGASGKWMFDDGTAMDSSGNDNHGTMMANATIIDVPQRGNVLSLEGIAYVTLPAEAFADVNEQITISLWQYGAESQPKNGIMFEGKNSYGKVLSAHVPWGDEVIYFDAGNVANGDYDRIVKTAQTSDYKGKWNHWVFTKDASEGTMSMYLNGQLWYSQTGKSKLMSGITSFTISRSTTSYTGLVDDFAVYAGCMSDTEVQQIYEAGLDNRSKLVCAKKPIGDLNQDCKIDYRDFAEMAVNWLK